MSSLDFETEKQNFRDYYNENHDLLESARNSFITLTTSLIHNANAIPISQIDGRVKDREECIKKFNRKYRAEVETENTPYTIIDHITDLIGLRIVCLYEDDIEKIKDILCEQLEVVDITDKIALMENTESSFGYKGLHLDIKLNSVRQAMPEYSKFKDFSFEIQIRTIIQDSWSVLDHKIKYKKSIPNNLKRRINSLAALFEVADREFKEIRDATEASIEKENISVEEIAKESDQAQEEKDQPNFTFAKLNAFSFLKIAKHFFPDYQFEASKADGFTQEILKLKPNISRGKFNFYMRENIAKVKTYQTYFEDQNPSEKMNPFALIRHCLYLGDKEIFSSILTKIARESFDSWLKTNS